MNVPRRHVHGLLRLVLKNVRVIWRQTWIRTIFTVLPRLRGTLQTNHVAIDNLTSRLDGLDKSTKDNVVLLNVQMQTLSGRPRGPSYALQHTEHSLTGEAQHSMIELKQDPLEIRQPFLAQPAQRLHRIERHIADQAKRADQQVASMEIQSGVLNIVSNTICDVWGLDPRAAQMADEICKNHELLTSRLDAMAANLAATATTQLTAIPIPLAQGRGAEQTGPLTLQMQIPRTSLCRST